MSEKQQQLNRDIEETENISISPSKKKIKMSHNPSRALDASEAMEVSDINSVVPPEVKVSNSNEKGTQEERSKTYKINHWQINDESEQFDYELAVERNEEKKEISLSLTARNNEVTETFITNVEDCGNQSNKLGKLCVIDTKDGPLDLFFNTLKDANEVFTAIKKPFESGNSLRQEGSNIKSLREAFSNDMKESSFYKEFQDYIANLCKEEKLYAPVGTIIQSSGHGKSKSMEWFARKNVVIFICFREKDSSGFPPRSDIANLFLSEMETEERGKLFIAALVDSSLKIIEEIKKEKTENIELEFYRYQPWNTDLSDKQKCLTFFEEVNAKCRTGQNIENLIKRYQNTFGEKRLYIFLDEAAALLEESQVFDTEDKKCLNKFRVMRRGVRSLRKDGCSMAVLLADTNGKIYHFVRTSRNYTSSERSVKETFVNLPPFFKILNIDINAEDDMKEFGNDTANLHKLIKKRTPETSLFFYGRPLWKSLQYDAKLVARQKLIYAREWHLIKKEEKLYATLAVLSSRTTLSNTFLDGFGKEMVARYMSTLYDIDKELKNYSSKYIHEPVLAEASAFFMSKEEILVDILSTLNQNLQSFSLNVTGAIGEVVAELILLLAFDRAVETKMEKEGVKEFVYSKPITVTEFLTSLLGNNANVILDTLKPEFKNGLVYFTQFIKKLDQLVYDKVKSEFLSRCAAAQLKDCQPNIDLLIIVILPNGEIRYIVVQAKNCAKPGEGYLRNAAELTVPYPDLYKGSEFDERRKAFVENDFLGIVMSIGAEVEEVRIAAVDVTIVRKSRSNKEEKTLTNFILHGLDIYPFLKRGVVEEFRNLINCDRRNLGKMYGNEMVKNVFRPDMDF